MSQERQKAGHDQHTKARVFYVGDGVYAWNFSRGPVRLEGTITHSKGLLSYIVALSNGRTIRHHVDQLRSCTVAPAGDADIGSDEDDMMASPHVEATATGTPDTVPMLEPPMTLRRSDRKWRPPHHLGRVGTCQPRGEECSTPCITLFILGHRYRLSQCYVKGYGTSEGQAQPPLLGYFS